MDLVIKRHPEDNSYLEFYQDRGDEPAWYLFTLHEDSMDAADFIRDIKDDIKRTDKACVKMLSEDKYFELTGE